jgi:hypothetical protein
MPVLNDFGDAGYARVTQQLDAFAAKLGIPKEIIRQYWSDTAHLPQTLDELKAWGMKPDREYGQVRYDQATGRWNPLGQGPTPGKTDLERGGFPHFINNNVGDAQRFQQVDASGNIFGGSWDAAYNQAHFDAQGRPIGGAPALGDDPNARQQIQGGRSAQGRAFDPNNYVAPVNPANPTGPYVSVVDGQSNVLGSQNEAENDFNQRTGGGSPQGAPPAGPGAGAPAPGSAGAGAPATPGVGLNAPAAAAANAAVLAWLAQRRLDEIDKPAFALKTQTELAQMRRDDAAQVWKQAYETATLTGTLNGQPTMDLTKQNADLTGYTGQGYASAAQAAFANLPPAQRTGEAAARIWQTIVPGLSPQEAAQMNEAGHQYAAATGQVMPDAVAAQHLARITGGRVTGTGAQATPAFQHQQNQDAISALTLLSNLRGPENAFAYANTLANLPDSVRQAIGAGMQNLPLTARNPAQAGLLNDVSGQAQQQTQQGGNAMMAAPGVGGQPSQVSPVTGPRTAAVQPAPTSGVGGATQQLMGGPMRMDPATQARIGVPAATQTGQPALVAAPGVGGTPVYGPRTQPAGPRLPFAANQLSPTDINRTDPYAQKVMWAGYENAGGDIPSGQWQYQNSLPRAYGPRSGRLRVA